MKPLRSSLLAATLSLLAATAATAQESPSIGAGIDVSSKRLNPPLYPPEAIAACEGGVAIVLVDVDKDGAIVGAVVERSSRNPYFDQAALDAARRWTYYPGSEHGERVSGRVRIPVEFQEHPDCWNLAEPDTQARPLAASMKRHPPRWPAEVGEKRLNGVVLLMLVIEADGANRLIKIGGSSEDQAIDAAALLAAAQWTYQPALSDGQPVRSVLRLPVYYGKKPR